MGSLIAGVSLWYTNQLVKVLAESEKKQIQLYANGLQAIMNADNGEGLSFLFQEIIEANHTVPVILTDVHGNPLSSKNIDINHLFTDKEKNDFLKEQLLFMQNVYPRIEIKYQGEVINYIYYQNSKVLTQLIYYPYIQLSIISVFILIGYLAFNSSRKAEQNRVWVGLAKETAHQLGTPISSLMAWIELLKDKDNFSVDAVEEMNKDVERLTMVTARFSNIGSAPVKKEMSVNEMLNKNMAYLSSRTSTKVQLKLHLPTEELKANLNEPLMGWVLENIVKNAVDAMEGEGILDVRLSKEQQKAVIEVQDNGKGITPKHLKKIFKPGFTTKTRGWGLGLTLVKRIIEEYHEGKISVASEVGAGTTFKIELNLNRA